jgi:hypothetical protein
VLIVGFLLVVNGMEPMEEEVQYPGLDYAVSTLESYYQSFDGDESTSPLDYTINLAESVENLLHLISMANSSLGSYIQEKTEEFYSSHGTL